MEDHYREIEARLGAPTGGYPSHRSSAVRYCSLLTDSPWLPDFEDMIKWLREIAGPEMSGFIEWRADRSTAVTQKRLPSEFLSVLQILDGRNYLELSELAAACISGRPVDIPLVNDDRFQYVVRTGDGLLSSQDEDSSGSLQLSDDVHPSLAALLPAAPTKTATATATLKSALPKYVFELGRLYVKDLGASSSATAVSFERTFFVVVVDVTTPKKPLWLIYDSYPENDLGDRYRVKLQDQDPVFPNVGRQFDAAQLIPRIQDWNHKLTVKAVESEILRTGRVVEARASTAKRTDVDRVLGAGWRGQR